MIQRNKQRRNTSDQKLLRRLKSSAKKLGYRPGALLLAGEQAAQFQKIAFIPILGPHPRITDEVAIDEEALMRWPSWVSKIVPPGSKWQRLHWPDGSISVRLIDANGEVLAARRISR